MLFYAIFGCATINWKKPGLVVPCVERSLAMLC